MHEMERVAAVVFDDSKRDGSIGRRRLRERDERNMAGGRRRIEDIGESGV